MTDRDRNEFRLFLHNCTDKQLRNVLKREEDAGRAEYVHLVLREITTRWSEEHEA